MDALKVCALAYSRLLNTEYIIKIGRKGQLLEICLHFEKSDFPHLVGLHKLKDIEQLRSDSREKIFNNILDGRITQEDLKKSAYYSKMMERLAVFPHIEEILDEKNLYFRYDPKKNAFSVIDADLVIEGQLEQEIIYLFLDRRQSGESHFCRTFFPRRTMDYTKNLPKYTLLYKEKRDLTSGTSVIQYDRLTPKDS